jgi:adenosine kinase
MDRTGLTQADIASRLDALIITRGAEGSDIYAGGEHHRIPAVPAEAVVDPTGCGDAYRAGLLFGITNDLDWPTSGRIASLLGSIKIASQGGQNHAFTVEEFDARFEAAFGYRFR